MAALTFITPDWPAPVNVKALQTTRNGGVSTGVYASLNLGDHVKDHPQHVAANRQLLSGYLPSEPVWLNQVHGVRVIDAALSSCLESADASFATRKQVVCVTMTADCLPVLLCDQAGTAVAAIHAGWRSLCDGVIEATVAAMPVQASQLMAWLGPAIGPEAFEVGGEVRAQFIAQDAQAELAFQPKGDKWLGDLYAIARQRLQTLGITQVYGGGCCTFNEPETFFSYRRDGDTGRMGCFIWLE
ncbi:peptidoglycan editing factor PgeF [Methylophilus sp.]|jgi:polyphenol oxidase|uniref:peptidoglycan editing factor PgeF n=1 Tax=Methylophilus sp. TaxID=29541 RepID=UPI0011D37108|nr:peptidoglycan editing factor PgeF [Methylophilus sp.]TXI47517.1 MAG: peptidoglycan editing factor PgeF [Methylophilus sp.]